MSYYFSPFRNNYKKDSNISCSFCNQKIINSQAVKNCRGHVIENDFYVWLVNYYPKFEGHTLIVPKRHIISIEAESDKEVLARNTLTRLAIKTLEQLFPGAGIELFLQYGPGSAASVPHLHWHVVPALPGDKLRSFEKLGHFYTTEEGKEKVLLFPLAIDKAKDKLQEALCKILE